MKKKRSILFFGFAVGAIVLLSAILSGHLPDPGQQLQKSKPGSSPGASAIKISGFVLIANGKLEGAITMALGGNPLTNARVLVNGTALQETTPGYYCLEPYVNVSKSSGTPLKVNVYREATLISAGSMANNFVQILQPRDNEAIAIAGISSLDVKWQFFGGACPVDLMLMWNPPEYSYVQNGIASDHFSVPASVLPAGRKLRITISHRYGDIVFSGPHVTPDSRLEFREISSVHVETK